MCLVFTDGGVVVMHHERRGGEDRRRANQRRGAGLERRRFPVERRSALSRVINDIALSFGIAPESLGVVATDDLLGRTASCPACEEKDRRCVKLEAELAEVRKEGERYRLQIEELLRLLAEGSR